MKVKVFITVLFFSVLVKANVEVSIRTDAHIYKSDPDNPVPPNTNHFEVGYAKLKYSTDIYEDLKFNALISLTKVSTENKLSKLNDEVEGFSITKVYSDSLSVTFGRDWNRAGGWENEMSTYKVYKFSDAGNEVSLNHVGIYVDQTFGDQKFSYAIYNAGEKMSGNNPQQVTMGVGAKWIGSFLNSKLMPLIHYHYMPQTRSDEVNSNFDFGLKFNLEKWDIAFDYTYNMNKNSTANEEEKAFILRSQFLGQHYRPIVKLIYNDINSYYESMNSVLALEYYPKEDNSNYNFHVAYINEINNQGSSDKIAHRMYLGFSIGDIKL